ncbi:hypothetical protein XELAEV_18032122mg [Xenopus laevis]|uniref:Uncharacterized protein n=1 Tax=Xenopus laevis TaxID=8355 RepID=A0A974CPL9_XENLA|nr:hypothetical protein XELAEV_18032122mg [Xenopus laevis]
MSNIGRYSSYLFCYIYSMLCCTVNSWIIYSIYLLHCVYKNDDKLFTETCSSNIRESNIVQYSSASSNISPE